MSESLKEFKEQALKDIRILHKKNLVSDSVVSSYEQMLGSSEFDGKLSMQKEVMESILGHELSWFGFSAYAEEVMMKGIIENPASLEKTGQAGVDFLEGKFDKANYLEMSAKLLDDLLKA